MIRNADSSNPESARTPPKTAAATEQWLKNAARRNLAKPVSVERAARIFEAAAEYPDMLSPEQRARLARAAAKLPPFTDEQVAAVGRLAATVDAQRRDGAG